MLGNWFLVETAWINSLTCKIEPQDCRTRGASRNIYPAGSVHCTYIHYYTSETKGSLLWGFARHWEENLVSLLCQAARVVTVCVCMSISASICLCVHVSMCPCVHVSMRPWIHVFFFPCVPVLGRPCVLGVHVSLFLSLRVSVRSMCPQVGMSTWPCVLISLCPRVVAIMCPSVGMSTWPCVLISRCPFVGVIMYVFPYFQVHLRQYNKVNISAT
jgi:hypothetical protein